jgi:hypothetical protein
LNSTGGNASIVGKAVAAIKRFPGKRLNTSYFTAGTSRLAMAYAFFLSLRRGTTSLSRASIPSSGSKPFPQVHALNERWMFGHRCCQLAG